MPLPLLVGCGQLIGYAVQPLRRGAARYARLNRRRPVVTQSCTALVVGAVGDAVMQGVERHREGGGGWDAARTGRLALYRGAIFGPLLSQWLALLERRVPGVPLKIAADQLLFGPWAVAGFYFTIAALEGRTLAEAQHRAIALTPPTLAVGIPFWCCVHCITFTAVPAPYRIAWISLVQVGFNAFMSGVNASGQ